MVCVQKQQGILPVDRGQNGVFRALQHGFHQLSCVGVVFDN